MLVWSVLALAAIGTVNGTPTTRLSTRSRDRRDTFFDIVAGGHGGTNLPVLVLPVPVPVYRKGGSCDARRNEPAADKNAKVPLFPPYIAVRSHEDVPQRSRTKYVTVDNRGSEPADDDFDESPIVVVDETSQSDTKGDPIETVIRDPSLRRRIKYVTKKVVSNIPHHQVKYLNEDEYPDTPRRVMYVSDDEISNTPVKQRAKYVTEAEIPNNASPRQRVQYVTEDEISDSPPRQRVQYVIEEEISNTTPRRRIKYVTEGNISNTQPRQRVKYVTEEVISSTLPPRQRVINVTEKTVSSTLRPRQPVTYKTEEQQEFSPQLEESPELPKSDDLTGEEPFVVNNVEFASSEPEGIYIPFSNGRGQIFATTKLLIRSYLLEAPVSPHLPAVVPRARVFPPRIPDRGPDALLEATIPGPSPPRPKFKRSMRLRIDLTVPRSDYTTAYDLAWHAGSNTARTVVEDGVTIFYRVPLLDGRLQYLKYEDDRMNGTKVQRCTLSSLLPASPGDRSFPGLPDLKLFHFVGYTEAEGQSLVERWRHWIIGRPGELGAVRGEALNYSHEFLLYRDRGEVVPLKYTVVTHSSVLGPNSDSYTHRYHLLPPPSAPLLPDTAQLCDVMIELKEGSLLPRQRDIDIDSARDFFATNSLWASHKGGLPGKDLRNGAGLELDKVVPNLISIGSGISVDKAGASAGLHYGAGNLSTGLDSDNVGGKSNLNLWGGGLGARLAAEKAGVSAKLNIGARGNAGLPQDKAGVSTNLNIESSSNSGLSADKMGASAKLNLGGGGSLGPADKGVNLNLNIGEGANVKEADKGGFNLNANLGAKDTGVAAGAAAGEFVKGAVSAAKDFFNPIGQFLGLTRPEKYDSMFEEFKDKYKRQYRDDDEEAVRKAQFIKNQRYTDAGNLIANTFKMGINYFADRLKEELKPLLSGVPPAPGFSTGKYEDAFKTTNVIKTLKDMAVPINFSWKEMGFNTPVHFQGEMCQSCSLLATTGATEGALFKQTKQSRALSPQDLIDCGMNGVNGCQESFPNDAFKYIQTKGLPSLEDYTFLEGKQDTCQEGKTRVTKIKEYYDLIPNSDKDVLRLAIYQRSPVVVVLSGMLDARSLQNHKEGALDDTRWCGERSSQGRHAVLAVGYDFSSDNHVFTIKNSWGAGWGQGGYADLVATQCGLLEMPSYPVLTQDDVQS